MSTESPALTLAQFHETHKGAKLTSIKPGEYLHDLYRDAFRVREFVIMASTQCGKTEWAFITSMAFAEYGVSHLYVFPTDQIRNQIVADRVDRMLYHRLYRHLAGDSDADNRGLKLLGKGSVMFVGSNSPVSFISYPADVITIDEYDRCDNKNLEMAVERLSASRHRYQRKISNPTFDGVGIAAEYAKSDMRRWSVKCHCGHSQILDFFKHLADEKGEPYDASGADDPNVVCEHCRKPFDRFGRGEWVAAQASDIRGYHISKLFSTQVTTTELISRYRARITSGSGRQLL